MYSTTKAENDEFNITQSSASYMSQKAAYATQKTGSAARRNASLQLWGKWNDSHQAHILEAAWFSFGFNFIGKCPKEGQSFKAWTFLFSQDQTLEKGQACGQVLPWLFPSLASDVDKLTVPGVQKLGFSPSYAMSLGKSTPHWGPLILWGRTNSHHLDWCIGRQNWIWATFKI